MLVSCNCKKTATDGNDKKEKSSLFEVLSESQYQGREEQGFEVIKDAVSLKALYQSVNIEQIPDVDFKKQQVVAVFLGQRNTGGYAIKVSNAYEKEGKILVEVTKISPQPGQNLTMALTNPYSIAKINSTKEIVFVEK
jgi:hypothetical protein